MFHFIGSSGSLFEPQPNAIGTFLWQRADSLEARSQCKPSLLEYCRLETSCRGLVFKSLIAKQGGPTPEKLHKEQFIY